MPRIILAITILLISHCVKAGYSTYTYAPHNFKLSDFSNLETLIVKEYVDQYDCSTYDIKSEEINSFTEKKFEEKLLYGEVEEELVFEKSYSFDDSCRLVSKEKDNETVTYIDYSGSKEKAAWLWQHGDYEHEYTLETNDNDKPYKLTRINDPDGDARKELLVVEYNENDENQFIQKATKYDTNGKIAHIALFTYEDDMVVVDIDFQGFLRRYKYQFENGLLKFASEINAKSNGDLIRVEKLFFSYDDDGNLIEKRVENFSEKFLGAWQNKLSYSWLTEYNTKGLVKLFRTEDETYEYTYDYDDHGNWIKKVTTKKQEPGKREIYIRELNYPWW
tara:strand:- start:1519 stop:2520 length:1002 start_codon:yes stop_codon:yes gene_type:complete